MRAEGSVPRDGFMQFYDEPYHFLLLTAIDRAQYFFFSLINANLNFLISVFIYLF